MKKTISKVLLFSVIFSSLMSVSHLTHAAISEGQGPTSAKVTESEHPDSQIVKITSPLKAKSIGELIQSFIEIFSYIVIILAVLALIYVGFQYVLYSAQGNSSKIKELHGWLLWIVVGVAIVISARVMIEVVINTIEDTGLTNKGVLDSARKAAAGK